MELPIAATVVVAEDLGNSKSERVQEPVLPLSASGVKEQ